jgi:hypothetical protein
MAWKEQFFEAKAIAFADNGIVSKAKNSIKTMG